MNLLLPVLRFLVALLIVLIRLLLPVLLLGVRTLGGLVSMSFAATVNGPTEFIDRLAAEWTQRFIELGPPIDRLDQIFSFCRLTALSMIVLGWLISVLFTVEILRVVFGFFI